MSDFEQMIAEAPTRATLETLEAALSCLEIAAERGTTNGGRALCAGLASDRVGYAVLGGYDAALRVLLAPRKFRRASFCVTEEGGGHPRSIATRLEGDARSGFTLRGTKTFATLASHAEWLAVVASTGTREDGKNDLRIAMVATGAPGVVLATRPALPFAPEIPHARLELEAAVVAELLEGDGFERYVKPFRTVEDTHVTLAIVGYAIGEARAQGWDDTALVPVAKALLHIADELDATDVATHIELDEALTHAKTALDALPWEKAPEPMRARWARDRPMLDVASRARAKRAEKARSA